MASLNEVGWQMDHHKTLLNLVAPKLMELGSTKLEST